MPIQSHNLFSVADLVDRCSRGDTTPLNTPQPVPGPAPTSPGLANAGREWADALADQCGDAAWCRKVQRGLFPPHLFPPRSAQPFYLRARFACNWGGNPTVTFPAGLWSKRILDWYVPRGQCFTTRLAYCDVLGDRSEVCVGFRVFRNDKLWFDGDSIETNHGNGVTSKMSRMSHLGTFYNRDSLTHASDSSNVIDFPSTFEPGEKISLDLTKFSGSSTAKLAANIRLTGYLYQQDLTS
jgi:hypothetical protein